MVRSGASIRFELPLEPGRPLIVGRDPTADLTLDDERVSRRHLRISAEDGGALLEDMGSTNGSFVEGERILRLHVQAGANVIVGATVLEIRAAGAKPISSAGRVSAPRGSTLHAAQPWLLGQLEEIPLAMVIQLLGSMRKSGVLEVHGPALGQVELVAGQVQHAQVEGLARGQPEKALYRMLGWNKGSFELKADVPTAGLPPLGKCNEELLLEGHRELDELARLAPRLPTARSRLLLCGDHASGETPLERRLLALIGAGPTLEMYLNTAPVTDLEAMTRLLGFAERGLVAFEPE